MNKPVQETKPELNVLGEPLQPCSIDPMTGFFRTGSCMAGPEPSSSAQRFRPARLANFTASPARFRS